MKLCKKSNPIDIIVSTNLIKNNLQHSILYVKNKGSFSHCFKIDFNAECKNQSINFWEGLKSLTLCPDDFVQIALFNRYFIVVSFASSICREVLLMSQSFEQVSVNLSNYIENLSYINAKKLLAVLIKPGLTAYSHTSFLEKHHTLSQTLKYKILKNWMH